VRYYPAFIDLSGKKAVVIGGGEVGERKIRTLIDAGAEVTVVAPEITPRVREWVTAGKVHHRERDYRDGDAAGAAVVMVATDDRPLNARIAQGLSGAACLVNVADIPGESNFIVPSLVVRGELVIAVSTGGASPALARRLREQLEREFGPEYALLVDILRRVRGDLKDRVSSEGRKRILRELVDADLLPLLREQRSEALAEVIQRVTGLDADRVKETVSIRSSGRSGVSGESL
jgi:precorrin-2 dehydrogenase/sirohydrochlorin ferrochelatase